MWGTILCPSSTWESRWNFDVLWNSSVTNGLAFGTMNLFYYIETTFGGHLRVEITV